MTRIRRYFGAALGLTVFAMAALPAIASASVAAPTFSVSTLQDPIYTLGTTLLTGIAALLVVVLAVKGPFYLVNMAIRAINKVFGRAKPKAA